jgi:molybdopterin converting factor small subunit
MNVTVTYNHYLLRQQSKRDSEEFELEQGATFRQLTERMRWEYGESFVRRFTERGGQSASVLINGTQLRDIDRVLRNGDRVNILVRTTGG